MSQNVEENMIIRYLTGECSVEELHKIKEWVSSSATHAEELIQMEYMDESIRAASMPQREIERVLCRIHGHRAKLTYKKHRVIQMHRLIRSVAAILLLVVMGGIYYMAKEYIYAPKMLTAKAVGMKPFQVALSDGSHVWLKPGSVLEYPERFVTRRREVTLKGEGYFEVKHDTVTPFVVHGGVMDVRVLGTVFNMRIDSLGCQAQVSLVRGKVQVIDPLRDNYLTLYPGQQAALNGKSGELTVQSVNAELESVWHDQLIPFHQVSIREIAHTLEQLYNVKVVVSPKMDEHCTYSGVVNLREDIDSVLQLIMSTVPMTYDHRGNTVYLYPGT